MRFRYLIVFLLAWTGQATAQNACSAVLPLSHLQFLMERALTDPGAMDQANFDRLGQLAGALDPGYVRHHLSGHTLSDHLELFEDLIGASSAVARSYREDGAAAALALANSSEMTELTIRSGRTLGPFPCVNNDPERQSQGITGLGTSAAPIGEGTSIDRNAWAVLGLSVVLGGLCITVIQRQLNRIAETNGREKRYFVKMPTEISWRAHGDVETLSTDVVDVSCNGAKLKNLAFPNAPPAGNITLTLGGDTLKASVQWTNQHFVGIKFAQPLNHSKVGQLRKAFPPGKRRPSHQPMAA